MVCSELPITISLLTVLLVKAVPFPAALVEPKTILLLPVVGPYVPDPITTFCPPVVTFPPAHLPTHKLSLAVVIFSPAFQPKP